MTFQPISSLFRKGGKAELDEVDVKVFVERYLRENIGVRGVLCKEVNKGIVVVRAESPTTRQEVCLLEYELGLALAQGVGYTLKGVRVIQ